MNAFERECTVIYRECMDEAALIDIACLHACVSAPKSQDIDQIWAKFEAERQRNHAMYEYRIGCLERRTHMPMRPEVPPPDFPCTPRRAALMIELDDCKEFTDLALILTLVTSLVSASVFATLAGRGLNLKPKLAELAAQIRTHAASLSGPDPEPISESSGGTGEAKRGFKPSVPRP
jgi:hypothetical protein